MLDHNELIKLSKSISQSSMQSVPEIPTLTSMIKIPDILLETNQLLITTVESVIINRLKENPDISEWVEKGITLHQSHESKQCEFCGSELPELRLEQLAAYFNAADADLKADLEALLVELRQIYKDIESINPFDKMNLYDELREEYSDAIERINTVKKVLLSDIAELGKTITEKKQHTTEKLPEITTLINFDALMESISGINTVIKRHNEKTDLFDKCRAEDSKRMEAHYLSTIYDKILKYDIEIITASKEISELRNGKGGDLTRIGLTALTNRITQNKARVQSTSKACKELNENLSKFLGYTEISFEVNTDETGYFIKRSGELARNLSEGEKSAIAFVFFVVQLKDEGFDTRNGIIVVDDPVSSLDSSSQFQAFSFMKHATAEAAQLFIFTHNFEFLKLVLNWLKNNRGNSQYFMIKNRFSETTGEREHAYIDKIDQTLEKFESEYHYLFNLVKNYLDDGTIVSAYVMPNIARKLLDTFLMYSVPLSKSPYERLQMIPFDDNKKTSIYKFCNDQSHITGSGFDPALVPETRKCVRYLLEMMEATAKQHYDYLIEETSL